MKNNFFTLNFINLVLGILFIIFPNIASKLIIYAAGLSIFLNGLKIWINNYNNKNKFSYGILLIALSVILVLSSKLLINFIFIIIGIIITIYSLSLYYTVSILKKLKDNNWKLKFIQSTIYFILGIFFIFNSFAAQKIILIIIGILLILSTINDIIYKLNVKKTQNKSDDYIDIDIEKD